MSSVTGLDSTSFVGDVIGQPRMRRGFADLGYSFKARRNWEMNFNLTYTRNLRTVYEFPSAYRDGYEVLGEWTNFVRPTERDEFTFGTLFDYTQGVEVSVGSGDAFTDARRPGGALYAQWDHRLLKNFKLLGGFQANKIGSISLDVVPRAGVLWSPWSRFTIKALYGEAFRAPGLNEIGMNYPGAGSLHGNPNLRPEKVKTFDLAASYQSKRFQAEIGYFHSDQNQSITLLNDASGVRWVNLGATAFNGAEAEGKYYLKKSFLLIGSALYQANSDQNGVPNITPIPSYQLKGGISYEAENGLTASLFDSYQGPLDRKYDGILNPSASSYHLLSSHFRYDLSRHLGLADRKGLALVAHAENLANREIWLPAWGEGMGSTMPVYRGRTVYFGIEVWFRHE
jgi:outer membrane receptor protein involved in Fe transport